MPSKLLVTGGAGFIGSNFIRYVLGNSEDVAIINLDKLTYAGSLDNLDGLEQADRHTFVQGDIVDRQLLDSLFRDHAIDAVVHFAAESHVDRSISGPAAFIETNILGTYSLLDAAAEHWRGKENDRARFLHVSTDEVFGSLSNTDAPFDEKTAFAPNSPYSASKAASDHLARAWHKTFTLPVVTTNCSNNYGPYQHDEKLIPTVIRSCCRGEPIPVYGDGSNIRDWLYVTDHCAGVWEVILKGRLGETYNLGGNSEMSNLDVVHAICAVMNEIRPGNAPHEQLISFVQDRPGHDWRYAIDANKVKRELGWQPRHDFASGMQKTVHWYVDNRYGE